MGNESQSHQDAFRLLDLGRRLVDLPLDDERASNRRFQEAMREVREITRERLDFAISELRVLFLVRYDLAPTPLTAIPQPSKSRNLETFLEWLTRLDLHCAFSAEGKMGSEFLANAERWIALDQAYGDPDNFWNSFQQLQDTSRLLSLKSS